MNQLPVIIPQPEQYPTWQAWAQAYIKATGRAMLPASSGGGAGTLAPAYVDVREHGVAGTGSPADTAVLQTLFNTQGRKRFLFNGGTYFVDRTLTVPETATLVLVNGARFVSARTSIRSAAYKWSASAKFPGHYYLERAAGGSPSIQRPDGLWLNDHPVRSAAMNRPFRGTANALNIEIASRWGFGDVDGLGFQTIYIMLGDHGDPDDLTANSIQINHAFTCNGEIEAGREQIFSPEVLIKGSPRNPTFPAEWFGASFSKPLNDAELLHGGICAVACNRVQEFSAVYTCGIYMPPGGLRARGLDKSTCGVRTNEVEWTLCWIDYVDDLRFSHMLFWGGHERLGSDGFGMINLSLMVCSDIEFENCEFRDGSMYNVGFLRGVIDKVRFRFCDFTEIQCVGIEYGPGRNYDNDNPDAIVSSRGALVGCTFSYAGRNAAKNPPPFIYGVKISFIRDLVITGCEFEPGLNYGHIYIAHNTQNTTITGNVFRALRPDQQWSASGFYREGDIVSDPADTDPFVYIAVRDGGQALAPHFDNNTDQYSAQYWRVLTGSFAIVWHVGRGYYGVENRAIPILGNTFDGYYHALRVQQGSRAAIVGNTFRRCISRVLYMAPAADSYLEVPATWNDSDTYPSGRWVVREGAGYFKALQSVGAGVDPVVDTGYPLGQTAGVPYQPPMLPGGTGTYWQWDQDEFKFSGLVFADNIVDMSELTMGSNLGAFELLEDFTISGNTFIRCMVYLAASCRRGKLHDNTYIDTYRTPLAIGGQDIEVYNETFIDCNTNPDEFQPADIRVYATAQRVLVHDTKHRRNKQPIPWTNYNPNTNQISGVGSVFAVKDEGARTQMYNIRRFNWAAPRGVSKPLGTGGYSTLGDGSTDNPLLSWFSGARKLQTTITYADALPVRGTYARGSIIFHSNPAAAGFVGWTAAAEGANTLGVWSSGGTYQAGDWVRGPSTNWPYEAVQAGGQAQDPDTDDQTALQYWRLVDAYNYPDPDWRTFGPVSAGDETGIPGLSAPSTTVIEDGESATVPQTSIISGLVVLRAAELSQTALLLIEYGRAARDENILAEDDEELLAEDGAPFALELLTDPSGVQIIAQIGDVFAISSEDLEGKLTVRKLSASANLTIHNETGSAISLQIIYGAGVGY